MEQDELIIKLTALRDDKTTSNNDQLFAHALIEIFDSLQNGWQNTNRAFGYIATLCDRIGVTHDIRQ